MNRLEHKIYTYNSVFREMEDLQRARDEAVDSHNDYIDECAEDSIEVDPDVLAEYIEEVEECDREAEKLKLAIEAEAA